MIKRLNKTSTLKLFVLSKTDDESHSLSTNYVLWFVNDTFASLLLPIVLEVLNLLRE